MPHDIVCKSQKGILTDYVICLSVLKPQSSNDFNFYVEYSPRNEE
jgi:hypothetical protein